MSRPIGLGKEVFEKLGTRALYEQKVYLALFGELVIDVPALEVDQMWKERANDSKDCAPPEEHKAYLDRCISYSSETKYQLGLGLEWGNLNKLLLDRMKRVRRDERRGVAYEKLLRRVADTYKSSEAKSDLESAALDRTREIVSIMASLTFAASFPLESYLLLWMRNISPETLMPSYLKAITSKELIARRSPKEECFALFRVWGEGTPLIQENASTVVREFQLFTGRGAPSTNDVRDAAKRVGVILA
jgi:hypothetical protein